MYMCTCACTCTCTCTCGDWCGGAIYTRLVTLSISPYGSFGPGFHSFISELSRRTGGAVPASLYEESTWATPRLGPFARMACSVAARRGLAESLRRWWGPASAIAPGGAGGAGAGDASGAGA